MGIVCSSLINRLGNQLSLIAAGMSFAKKYNHEFMVTSHVVNHPNPTVWKPYEFIYDKFKFLPIDVARSFTKIEDPYSQIVIDVDQYKDCENAMFTGYFQSAEYYDDELVRGVFGNTEEDNKRIKEKYGDLSDTVSVSVRRGDYLYLPSIFIVPDKKWYEKCYSEYFKGKDVLVSGDDLGWCKANLNFEGANVRFLDEPDDVETMRIKACCKNHIVPPSTYSWWSAYLSGDDAKVVLPDLWFNPTSGIDSKAKYCKGWIKERLT